MAQMATELHGVRPAKARARALVVPREHGAWGILLVPLVTGAAAAAGSNANWPGLTLFVVAALALFWLRTPTESLVGTSPIRAQSAEERRMVTGTIAGLASVAAVAVGMLLWGGRNAELLLIGGVSAAAFGAQAVVRKLGRNMRMPAQMIGSVGLTSTAAGAYYVMTGRLDASAVGLWIANWLFAANQIHYVQLRIHAAKAASVAEKVRRGRMFLAGQAGMIVAALLAWHFGFIAAVGLIAFAPVLWRGLAWFVTGPKPLNVHQLGWSELRQAVTFGVLLIAAMRIGA